MTGIDLNKKIDFICASLRYFGENEYHVTRVCPENVLLLVFEGCLRFAEDGTEYEIYSGEYFIQHEGGFQSAGIPSDAPEYLYVHFSAAWGEGKQCLPSRGKFSYSKLRQLIEKTDATAHSDSPMIEKNKVFYELLCALYSDEKEPSLADLISRYIREHIKSGVTLDELSSVFHFSKNHIISLFKREYRMTPIAFLNYERLKYAEYLLEATSLSAEEICESCGFNEYSHFYRQFLKRNGQSPTLWRSQKRIKPI